MSNTHLWCLVLGEKAAFAIIIDSSVTISDLQREIKKERDRSLRGIAASDLHLWKVRYL
jgi:hypothetical protein